MIRREPAARAAAAGDPAAPAGQMGADEKPPAKPASATPSRSRGGAPGDTAFDLWLSRGLHQLYDNVAKEPIPDELLRMIEDDRASKAGGQDKK